MRFLADMGVSPRIAVSLRSLGYDAVHLSELGLQRLPDPEIFQKAMTEQRVILTFDLDFGEISALSRGSNTSVVLFRLANTRTDFVWQRLCEALAHAEEELRVGAVVVIEDHRIEVRNLPIGRGG